MVHCLIGLSNWYSAESESSGHLWIRLLKENRRLALSYCKFAKGYAAMVCWLRNLRRFFSYIAEGS